MLKLYGTNGNYLMRSFNSDNWVAEFREESGLCHWPHWPPFIQTNHYCRSRVSVTNECN